MDYVVYSFRMTTRGHATKDSTPFRQSAYTMARSFSEHKTRTILVAPCQSPPFTYGKSIWNELFQLSQLEINTLGMPTLQLSVKSHRRVAQCCSGLIGWRSYCNTLQKCTKVSPMSLALACKRAAVKTLAICERMVHLQVPHCKSAGTILREAWANENI